MIRSMTAFGSAEATGDWGELTWEVRSVNSRYLEVFVRMPEELRALESTVRERVRKGLSRGKVELNLRYKGAEAQDQDVVLNKDYAAKVIQASKELESMMFDAARVSSLELLRWPGMLRQPEKDMKALRQATLDTLDAALSQLVTSRESEGERLKDMILTRIEAMEPLVDQARDVMPEVVQANRERITEKLVDALEKVDSDRVEQEMVMIAQRMDVDEEMDRLRSHTAELRKVLKRKEPVGRRMDFLMQEFNREANTLGSKSADTRITAISVELKVLIEQMREQIQNIE